MMEHEPIVATSQALILNFCIPIYGIFSNSPYIQLNLIGTYQEYMSETLEKLYA